MVDPRAMRTFRMGGFVKPRAGQIKFGSWSGCFPRPSQDFFVRNLTGGSVWMHTFKSQGGALQPYGYQVSGGEGKGDVNGQSLVGHSEKAKFIYCGTTDNVYLVWWPQNAPQPLTLANAGKNYKEIRLLSGAFKTIT